MDMNAYGIQGIKDLTVAVVYVFHRKAKRMQSRASANCPDFLPNVALPSVVTLKARR